MQREVPSVAPETLLNDLFEEMSNSKLPLSVIDPGGRLKGVVIRGAVLAGLAGNSGIEAGDQNELA
ncbi:Glycine betaine transport ATP-binding protein OpuAA [compost metagenome]